MHQFFKASKDYRCHLLCTLASGREVAAPFSYIQHQPPRTEKAAFFLCAEPRISGICCSLQGKRGCSFLLYTEAAFFLCAEPRGLLQPPRREEAAPFSYIQHHPPMMEKAAFFLQYVQNLGYLVYDAASKERRSCPFLFYTASSSNDGKGCFFSYVQSLRYLVFAAASKERRGCLFL
jgi:hypothetical protein